MGVGGAGEESLVPFRDEHERVVGAEAESQEGVAKIMPVD